MRIVSALIAGLLFGSGIMISGMANPAKVLNFFDIAGTWDPSLAFVMGGALIITFIGYRLVLARERPLFASGFQLPAKRDLDARLIVGSGIFGIGWGIAGVCPGAGIPALGTGRQEIAIFVAAMITGLVLARIFMKRMDAQSGAEPTAPAGE